MKGTKLIMILFVVFFVGNLNAQNDTLQSRKNAVNIYLDAENIQYIKDNITFVNYVRDLKNADVHILETTNSAGNGGEEYFYIFTGQNKYFGRNDTLKFNTTADNSNDEIRQKQVQILKLGLMQYVAHSQFANDISINFSKPITDVITEDKWRSWVINLNGYAFVRAESSYKNYSVWSSVNASKITDDIKIEIDYNNNINGSVFYFDDNPPVKSKTTSNFFSALVAKSLGNHWALGGKLGVGNSTYSNLKIKASALPTIEYNIFDYNKYNTIQLRIQYSVGAEYDIYYDTTIYNQTEQLLGLEKLGVAFKINKKWGYVNSSVSFSNYMYDFSKNSVNFQNSINIRLFKGFSVNFNGAYAIIHDQIGLPKQGLNYEEILLRQQENSTDFSYWLSAGISYTFGSIYNNVVNPRFNDIY